MAAPLRAVVDRGPLRGPGQGWYDRLECDHEVTFDGVRVQFRRCRQCPPEKPKTDTAPVSDDQEALW